MRRPLRPQTLPVTGTPEVPLNAEPSCGEVIVRTSWQAGAVAPAGDGSVEAGVDASGDECAAWAGLSVVDPSGSRRGTRYRAAAPSSRIGNRTSVARVSSWPSPKKCRFTVGVLPVRPAAGLPGGLARCFLTSLINGGIAVSSAARALIRATTSVTDFAPVGPGLDGMRKLWCAADTDLSPSGLRRLHNDTSMHQAIDIDDSPDVAAGRAEHRIGWRSRSACRVGCGPSPVDGG